MIDATRAFYGLDRKPFWRRIMSTLLLLIVLIFVIGSAAGKLPLWPAVLIIALIMAGNLPAFAKWTQ